MLTQEELKQELECDIETGLFRWRQLSHANRKRGWFAGARHSQGYRVIEIHGKLEYAHTLIWLYAHGIIPWEIDHINEDRSDNRISNLRPANRTRNMANEGIRSTNSSGVRNTCWDKSRQVYLVQMRTPGGGKIRKRFKTLEEAASFVESTHKELHGEYSFFNRGV